MPPTASNQTPPIPGMPQRRSRLPLFAAVILGVIAVVFIILTIVGFSSANNYKSTYDSAKAQGYKDGQAAQQKADAATIAAATEEPFATYTAPDIFGAFKVKYPKNWSLYVQTDNSANGQITITMNPGAVINEQGANSTYAAQVQLVQALYSDQQQNYKQSQDNLKASDIVVSGIKGSRYDGKFDGQNDGSVVIIPVRNTTLVFSTTNKSYLNEFNQILAQAKISP